jgi:hypothetical protein
MSLVSLEQAQPSRTALAIEDGLPFNDWRRLGQRLARMGDSSKWWIGDWLCYGERYRRDYRTAMEELDRTFDALRSYAYVSSKVTSATRVADLSWSHHRLVARLDPAEQARWLDDALRQGWSVRELEQALAEGHSPRPPTLTLRAVGELHDLCTRAAERAGLDPGAWAAGVLEHAAREQLKAAS